MTKLIMSNLRERFNFQDANEGVIFRNTLAFMRNFWHRVAEDKNGIAGVICARSTECPYSGRLIVLELAFYTRLNSMAGNRAGLMLIKEMLQFAKAIGAVRCYMGVRADNDIKHALERHGFKLIQYHYCNDLWESKQQS